MSAADFHMAPVLDGDVSVEHIRANLFGITIGKHRMLMPMGDFRTLGFKVARALIEAESRATGLDGPNVLPFRQREA